MRKAYNDYSILMLNDVFIGISLGYDYCSEHEWGIDKMRRRFGIPDSSNQTMGIKNRQITKCPDNLIFLKKTYKKEKYAILYTGYQFNTREESEKHLPDCLRNYIKDLESLARYDDDHSSKDRKDLIITAWANDGFGVAVKGEKEVSWLKELYSEFQKNNVAITRINTMPKNPFSNSSLSLLIVDRLPQDILQMMYSADKEHFDLIDYEEKIGMTKIKEKNGNKNGYERLKYYMACSANWIYYNDAEKRETEKKRLGTEYDILYWVNYSDDDRNFGWYTVEEIREWLTGTKKLVEIRKA
jgi:hypothetical protein